MSSSSSEDEDAQAVVVAVESNAEDSAAVVVVDNEDDDDDDADDDDDDSDDSDDSEKSKSSIDEEPPKKRAMESSLSSAPQQMVKKSKKKKIVPHREGMPTVKSLMIPFRAVKRTMKIDKDIGTVQNEAAIICTHAMELFLGKLAKESHNNAVKRGRNTIRYEDLAETRATNSNLSFLETLIP